MTRVPFAGIDLGHRIPLLAVLLRLSRADFDRQAICYRDDLRFARMRHERAKATSATHDAPTVRMARRA